MNTCADKHSTDIICRNDIHVPSMQDTRQFIKFSKERTLSCGQYRIIKTVITQAVTD